MFLSAAQLAQTMYIRTEVRNYAVDQVMNLLKEGGNAEANRDIDADAQTC